MSDQRKNNWFSGRLRTAPIAAFWQVSRTVQDPSIPNLPLETPAAPPADTFVPLGRSALVVGAIVLAAWAAPQFSALKVSTAIETGPTVEQVQPPKVADQQVARNAAWRVTWDTQRRPKAIVSVDNPPLRKATPSVEAWRQTWTAQARPPVAAIIPSAVVEAQVPAAAPQAQLWRAWASPGLSALKVSTATEGGDWVLPVDQVDNPPPQARAWLWAVLAKHQQARFGSYSSSVYTQPVSDPPRLKRQDLTSLWPRGWTLPPVAAKFPQTAIAPAVDNPPPRSLTPSVEAWRATWTSQRSPLMVWAPPGAAVDNPPPRLLTPSVEAWRQTWKAQRAPLFVWPTAVTAVDDPPPRRLEIPAAIKAWQPPTLTAIKVSTATEDGVAPPVAGDPPPVRLLVQPDAVKAWQPKPFGSYASAVYTYVAPPDNPPPRVVQPTTIREQWQARATWRVPQKLLSFTPGGTWVAPTVPTDTVFGGVWNYPEPITGLPPIHGRPPLQPSNTKEWLGQVAREVSGPDRTIPQRAQEAVAAVAEGYVGAWDQARAEAELRAVLLAQSIRFQQVYTDLLARVYERLLSEAMAQQAVAAIEQAQAIEAARLAAWQRDEDDAITILLLS